MTGNVSNQSTHFECDCGAIYSHVDQLHACANRNHGLLNKQRLCGNKIGRELLLPGMQPGKGISAFCMLFENHPGECSPDNPDLDLGYQSGDLG